MFRIRLDNERNLRLTAFCVLRAVIESAHALLVSKGDAMRDLFNRLRQWIAERLSDWGDHAVRNVIASAIGTAVPLIILAIVVSPPKPNPLTTGSIPAPTMPPTAKRNDNARTKCEERVQRAQLQARKDAVARSADSCIEQYKRWNSPYLESRAREHCSDVILRLEQTEAAIMVADAACERAKP